METIVNEKLSKYFSITEKAYNTAKNAKIKNEVKDLKKEREDFLNMIKCYIEDAKHFNEHNDKINALAALSYAHGWLDAGARLGLWDVHDNKLFTVD